MKKQKVTAREKAGTAKNAPRRRIVGRQGDPAIPVSDVERHKMISDRAYEKSLRRDQGDRDPEQDWLDAEREVDAELLRSGEDPDVQ